MHNPTIGGHPAFNVKDIKTFIAKLKTYEIPFTDAKVYAMPNVHQVYLFDPNANIIEINQNVKKWLIIEYKLVQFSIMRNLKEY